MGHIVFVCLAVLIHFHLRLMQLAASRQHELYREKQMHQS